MGAAFPVLVEILDRKGKVQATQAVFAHAAAFSPDGLKVGVKTAGRKIALWDLRDGRLQVHTLQDSQLRFLNVAVNDRGELGAVQITYDYFSGSRRPPELVLFTADGSVNRYPLTEVRSPHQPLLQADATFFYLGLAHGFYRVVESR